MAKTKVLPQICTKNDPSVFKKGAAEGIVELAYLRHKHRLSKAKLEKKGYTYETALELQLMEIDMKAIQMEFPIRSVKVAA
jgi:hypothetical protein